MLGSVAREIVTGETPGELYALPEGYPAFLRGDGVVVGELVTVSDSHALALLRQLDRFEGYYGKGISANLYVRDTVSVTARRPGASDIARVDAHAYIYADDHRARTLGRPVAGGDWAAWRANDTAPL